MLILLISRFISLVQHGLKQCLIIPTPRGHPLHQEAAMWPQTQAQNPALHLKSLALRF